MRQAVHRVARALLTTTICTSSFLVTSAQGPHRVNFKSEKEVAGLGAAQGEDAQARVLEWQSSKARLNPTWVAGVDRTTERRVQAWLGAHLVPGALHGRSALCVGARAGGEVRAFRAAGAFAVGVDLFPAEQGNGSTLVLRGDAASLQFASGSVDVLFTNVMDHFPDLGAFASEVDRVLKPDGLFVGLVLGQIRIQDEWAFRDTGTDAFYAEMAKAFANAGGRTVLCHLRHDSTRQAWLQRVRENPSSLRGRGAKGMDTAVWRKLAQPPDNAREDDAARAKGTVPMAACPVALWKGA